MRNNKDGTYLDGDGRPHGAGELRLADAKGVAAHLVDDVSNGRPGAVDRALQSMRAAGIGRTEGLRRLQDGVHAALINEVRHRRS